MVPKSELLVGNASRLNGCALEMGLGRNSSEFLLFIIHFGLLHLIELEQKVTGV